MLPARARPVATTDLVAAGVLLVLGQVEMAASDAEWWRHAVAAAGTLPVALRGRWPVWTLTASVLALSVLTVARIDEFAVAHLLALMLGTYTVGSRCPMPRSWLALSGTLVAAYANSALARSPEPGDLVFATILLAVPWAAGLGMRRSRSRAQELEELTVQLEASRSEHAQLLLDVERLRIARDLHDSLAQTLNAVVVHAQVAEAALGTDPAVAKHSLDRIVEVSRRSLSEIRDLLATLRGHDQHAEAPRLEDVARLVERFREDGMRIELRDTGLAGAGGTAVDATLARILHEALTNAGRHAAGEPVTVTIERGDDIVLEVRNAAAAAPGESTGARYGLTGMRERAHLLGGELVAERDLDDFVVTARLPRTVSA